MKNTLKINTLIILFFTACFFSSCDGDEVVTPPKVNDEELITSVELTFVNTATNAESVFKFADPDGDGGAAPTQTDTIRLDTNSTYNLTVRFLDESSTDVEDITEEVKEEADEHLVCYTVSGSSTATVTDKDANNLDLGLEATIETMEAETGTFGIALKHQPDVKDGSCGVGETDVEVDFQLEIK